VAVPPTTSFQPAVQFTGVSKSFGDVKAVDHVSFEIRRGECFSLVGPSGCGKTTTLRLLAGLEQPDDGGEIRMRPYQRRIAMVFQNYALFPQLSVERNVAFGLGRRKMPRHEIPGKVGQALEMVRLRLKTLNRRLGITFICVTHDQEEALTMSDRIAVMDQARIAQPDSPAEIYENPRTEFVARFIGESNFFEGQDRCAQGQAESEGLHLRAGEGPADLGRRLGGAAVERRYCPGEGRAGEHRVRAAEGGWHDLDGQPPDSPIGPARLEYQRDLGEDAAMWDQIWTELKSA